LTDSQPRPEVVEAIFSALTDMDPSKLDVLSESGVQITPTERAAANDLYLASLIAGIGHKERWLQAMQILLGDHRRTVPPSWAELFDELTADRAAQLRNLYDDLPDGARAEYDRRHGRPAKDA
jgi:hypothetical protein